MAYPSDSSLMAQQYTEAADHLKASRKDKAIEVARLNLTDPNLSRYYQIKNLLLVATADDWYERERSRRKAEGIWKTAHDLTKEDERLEHRALNELRQELARLAEQQQASAPETIDDDKLGQGLEDVADDDDDADSFTSKTEEYGDDEVAVRDAEREVFGDDSNIIAMYEQAAAQGRARRLVREAEEERELAAASLQTPLPSSEA